jgi:pilus assembly protein CpaC
MNRTGKTHFRRSRLSSTTGRRPAAFSVALVLYVIVVLAAMPTAQQPANFAPSAAPVPAITDTTASTEVELMVGRSTVLNVGAPIARISLTVADIADAMVTGPSQLLVHGKQPGTISLFVWDKSGAIKTYEVRVRRDLSALSAHLKQLFPGETITALGSGKDVVISGTVSGQYVIEKAADVAGGYVEKKENVVNLLKAQEGVASNQVMLRVRFAEVSRSALQELGASFFAHGFKNDWFGRTAPPGVPSPVFDNEKGLVFSDFLNLFVFNAKEGLGGVVRALQTKGLFQSLAEPNLIATNGKEASFLAGGEYPYPVVQTGNGGNAITIMFKEFGVRLSFTPTVLGGDLVHLKVKPEVSSLDFANAVQIDGFRIPALSTRRTETEVELRDGQTFAIAGLMNNTLTNTMSKIPGIGDIPVLGHLFRSKAHQKNQTELVVMITPTIIRKGQAGVSEGLPALVEPYLDAPNKTYPNPDAYVGSPRYPANQPVTRPTTTPAPDAPAATPSRPIAAPATLPQGGPVAPPSGVEAPTVKVDMVPVPGGPVPPASKDEQKAQQKLLEQQRKAAEAAEKERAAEEKRMAEEAEKLRAAQEKHKAQEQKAADKRAAEEKKKADKAAREQAQRDADALRKSEEAARKKAAEEQKRRESLSDASERLKAAQAAYQAEIEKLQASEKSKARAQR